MDGDARGDKLHEIYHTGMRDMHALEDMAIELTQRQVDRLTQRFMELTRAGQTAGV